MGASASSPRRADGGANWRGSLAKGARVEAFMQKENKWFAAKVRSVADDGVLRISFNGFDGRHDAYARRDSADLRPLGARQAGASGDFDSIGVPDSNQSPLHGTGRKTFT